MTKNKLGRPGIMTDRELQIYLGKSSITLYRWRESGRLPYHRIGGQIAYTSEDLQLFFESAERNRKGKTKE